MAKNVKITTKMGVLDLVCPHYCWGCERLGAVLCDRCKNYIIRDKQNYCPNCYKKIERRCEDCEMPFDATFMVGWRTGVLMKVVEGYKYNSVRALGEVLGELLAERVAPILGEVVVVPLPTATRHVRQRGLDHTLTVAKSLARRREWKWERVLARAANTVQVGASATKRVEQAGRAYRLAAGAKVRKDVTYLLVDDVWTTGASMGAAAGILREAGAEKVMAAIVAVSNNAEMAE